MGEVKRWQVAVLVVAGLILAGSIYFSIGRGEGSVRLASTIIMVDVTTGDLFEYSISGRRAVMVPERHPDTGKIVLIPVDRDENGRWVIGPRERNALGAIEGEPTAVDRQTGEVSVSGDRPRRVR